MKVISRRMTSDDKVIKVDANEKVSAINAEVMGWQENEVTPSLSIAYREALLGYSHLSPDFSSLRFVHKSFFKIFLLISIYEISPLIDYTMRRVFFVKNKHSAQSILC